MPSPKSHAHVVGSNSDRSVKTTVPLHVLVALCAKAAMGAAASLTQENRMFGRCGARFNVPPLAKQTLPFGVERHRVLLNGVAV